MSASIPALYSSISASRARRRRLRVGWIIACAVWTGTAYAQYPTEGTAALPYAPYWWSPQRLEEIQFVPLLWFNDIDGSSGSCCVIGLGARNELGPATLWWGIAFGTGGEGGQPAAIEGAVELSNGGISFRHLHGRNGFDARYEVIARRSDSALSLSLGVGSVWVDDPRYLETVIMFECPSNAPSAPCEERPVPYTWSEGRDDAITAVAEWGRGVRKAPRFTVTTAVGLKVAGGEHEYLRGEATSILAGNLRSARWWARLAGGWASNRAPQQRRFLLQGADAITQWLNPYLAARGALFQDVPYFVQGGPHLRAYVETQPMVKSYLGLSGELSREASHPSGFRGRLGVFGEAAWTPGIPSPVGPADLNPNGDLLFDWQQLPEGVGNAQGQFRASVLQIPSVWADAGITATGAYKRIAVMFSFPLWVSEPSFGSDPLTGDERRAFAIRWNLTVIFFPSSESGE